MYTVMVDEVPIFFDNGPLAPTQVDIMTAMISSQSTQYLLSSHQYTYLGENTRSDLMFNIVVPGVLSTEKVQAIKQYLSESWNTLFGDTDYK